jgi:hypothetical protein
MTLYTREGLQVSRCNQWACKCMNLQKGGYGASVGQFGAPSPISHPELPLPETDNKTCLAIHYSSVASRLKEVLVASAKDEDTEVRRVGA